MTMTLKRVTEENHDDDDDGHDNDDGAQRFTWQRAAQVKYSSGKDVCANELTSEQQEQSNR